MRKTRSKKGSLTGWPGVTPVFAADIDKEVRPTDDFITCTAQAAGAIPNGTRIVKQNFEAGDGHQNGDQGVVMGSLNAPGLGFGYFIAWDDRPTMPIFTLQKKVRKL